MSDKRGAMQGGWIPIAFLVVAVLIGAKAYGINVPFLGSATGNVNGGGSSSQINVNVSGSPCTVDTAALTLGPVEDFYSGAKLSSAYHRWYTQHGDGNWVDQGYVSDGTVKSASPGDKVAVYYNLNGSATSFYPRHAIFTVPCGGAFSSAQADTNFKDSYRLGNMSRAADVNFIVQNIDTTNNAVATPQKILAGQQRAINIELDFANKETFGTPFSIGNAGITGAVGQQTQGVTTPPTGGATLLTCFYNATLIQSLALQSGKPTYSGQYPLHAPLTRSGIGSGSVVSGGTAQTGWVLPGYKSNEAFKDKLLVTADPTNPSSSTNENVNCTMIDGAWYLPTNGNVPNFGFENDKQADVGANDFSFVIYLNGTA